MPFQNDVFKAMKHEVSHVEKPAAFASRIIEEIKKEILTDAKTVAYQKTYSYDGQLVMAINAGCALNSGFADFREEKRGRSTFIHYAITSNAMEVLNILCRLGAKEGIMFSNYVAVSGCSDDSELNWYAPNSIVARVEKKTKYLRRVYSFPFTIEQKRETFFDRERYRIISKDGTLDLLTCPSLRLAIPFVFHAAQ